MRKYQIVITLSLVFLLNIIEISAQKPKRIKIGAENTWLIKSFLGDEPFAIVANHTSMVGNSHLADTLISMKLNLKKIFSPEHGFRGKAEAGALLYNSRDSITGLPVISLYGDHKKPTAYDLKDIDIVVFDIQDVGARFYTYFSTLSLVMEACAENNKKMLILDRPNPNGFYVDGPVLKYPFKSFVGMHPIPIVHGMTAAEFAYMINDESWIDAYCDLSFIKCQNYTHDSLYQLPVPPSPNLKSMEAVYLYPSLCLFEGTTVSIGRGTDTPFEIYGHPDITYGDYTFTPKPNEGSKHPKLEEKLCKGENLKEFGKQIPHFSKPTLKLNWIISAYQELHNDSTSFFTPFFNKLAGNSELQDQIKDNLSEKEIRKSWENELIEFNKIRQKYLLYPDFKKYEIP